MKKYIMLAAVLYISVTAMAQTSPATSWGGFCQNFSW